MTSILDNELVKCPTCKDDDCVESERTDRCSACGWIQIVPLESTRFQAQEHPDRRSGCCGINQDHFTATEKKECDGKCCSHLFDYCHCHCHQPPPSEKVERQIDFIIDAPSMMAEDTTWMRKQLRELVELARK